MIRAPKGRPAESSQEKCHPAAAPPKTPRPSSPSECAAVGASSCFAARGEILRTVEAPDVEGAKAAAAVQFELDDVQRNRIIVQELA